MKKWYTSKTLWVNVIATGAIIAQAVTGKEVLPPEAQAAIITVLNMVLRAITKESIQW